MQVLDVAPYGMVSLETTLALVITKLIRPGHLDWSSAIATLTCNPARVLGMPNKGTLRVGADADLTIIDAEATWQVKPEEFLSKSSNTPLAGITLYGVVTNVIVAGVEKQPAPATATNARR